MTRQLIATPEAPGPIGPYAQGIRVGDFLFTSGQIGLDPASGELAGEDVGAQTRQALANLQAVLLAGGASLAAVVKTTVFLQDMQDFAAMNAVYAEAFAASTPARSTVQVAGLPRAARVEVEAVAYIEPEV
jgi:2-iminobutanoate/2-iminopropanoate deaminase